MCKMFIFFFIIFSYVFLQVGRDILLRLLKIFVNNMQVFNIVIKIFCFIFFLDIVIIEVFLLFWVDNNLIIEEYEECGKEVCKLNLVYIFVGKMLSFYMYIRLIFV